MAEMDVERSKRLLWPWILALVVLVGSAVLGWVVMADEDELAVAEPIGPVQVGAAPAVDVTPPVPAVAEAPVPVAQAAGIPVSEIVASPATWTGRTLGGEVRVTEVVSDRGFWIADRGQRLFVVLDEAGGDAVPRLQAGQPVRLAEAMVYAGNDPAALPGTLEPQARQVAQGQPAVLVVDARNVAAVPAGG